MNNITPRRTYEDSDELARLEGEDGKITIPPSQRVTAWTDEEVDALLGISEDGIIDPAVYELALADLVTDGDGDFLELFSV